MPRTPCALAGPQRPSATATPTVVDVAVVRLPTVANATDIDPLAREPQVGVRWVSNAAALGDPDLVILPGTKRTVADLAWLRATGLDAAIERSGAAVLGICGGYQMLGRTIADPAGVEAPAGTVVDGLGWLPVDTTFAAQKLTRQRRGRAAVAGGHTVSGYEIHHGCVRLASGAQPWLHLDGGAEGAMAVDGRLVLGTSLHGLLESDGLRGALLGVVAERRHRALTPSTVSFAAAREAQLDRLADAVEQHLDLVTIERLIQECA